MRHIVVKTIIILVAWSLGMGMISGIAFASQDGIKQPYGALQSTPTVWPVGTYATPSVAVVTPVPPPVQELSGPEGDDILNILLLGSDSMDTRVVGRTDAIMIASINRTQGSISLLSLPRDLFVYIPGWTMQRINTAFSHGTYNDYPGGGLALLKDTLQYNLGLSIDFYAHVDFAAFQGIVDALGGVDIAVDCAIEDWKLTDPELDLELEESWEMTLLPIGVHHLDGYSALWYARSRRTGSDFDRGRRQQDLLRAIWHRVSDIGLVSQLPSLWNQVTEYVDTDMGVEDIVGLLPVAMNFDADALTFYRLQANVHTHSWGTPGGGSVQLPDQAAVASLMQYFMLPSTDNVLVSGAPTVEVVNASGYYTLDRVAADRLRREGLAAYPGGDDAEGYRATTTIYDLSGRTKGSALPVLQAVLRVQSSAVIVEPDAERGSDYLVIIGGDYNACNHTVLNGTVDAN